MPRKLFGAPLLYIIQNVFKFTEMERDLGTIYQFGDKKHTDHRREEKVRGSQHIRREEKVRNIPPPQRPGKPR